MKAKEKKKKLNTYFTTSSLLTNEIQKRKTFPVSNYKLESSWTLGSLSNYIYPMVFSHMKISYIEN